MIRCPRCGIRLMEQNPVCRVHGEAPLSRVAAGDVPQSLDLRADGPILAALRAQGYRVIGKLGEGGFGVVLAAERVMDGQAVAIKITRAHSARARSELSTEAELMRTASSAVAPLLVECGTLCSSKHEAHGFLAMERIVAPSMASLLEDAAPFDTAEFLRIARGLIAALRAMHAHGVVHRDLKPENVFVFPDGSVRLIDFGLSRPVGAERRADEAGAPPEVGTAEYMSPEQCSGDDAGDVRTDLYSAGIMLYEALAGAPPFWGQATDVREQHLSRRPRPLGRKGSLAALDAVVRTCLAKLPEERYASADGLAEAFEKALGGPRTASVRPPAPEAVASESRRDSGREKRRVGLLFFTSNAKVVEVQQALSTTGGQLVQHAGAAVVAAFGHDAADHPVRLAFNAALALRGRRLAERVVVDVGEVSIQRRRDGSARFFGAALADVARQPRASDAPGVLFTQAAADTLPDARFEPLTGEPARLKIAELDPADEATTFGLDRPMLVGRDTELKDLSAWAKRAFVQSRPTLATVYGEAGYGKSHLSREIALAFVHDAAHPEVIRLSVREGLGGAPSQAYPELMCRVLGVPEQAEPGVVRRRLMEAVPEAEREHGLAAALFALGVVGSDDSEVLRLAAAPSALRLAAARVLGAVLRAASIAHPLVLIMDDAHLADEATLDALEYATLVEAGARIFACVFVRPGFEAARPMWGARAGFAETLQLKALDGAAATDLARRLLFPVEYVPPQALQRLVARTEGVPRLMVELVRGLKRDGIVRRVDRGTSYFLATDELDRLPDLPIVQWNARREVEALPLALQAHAKVCALLGNHFGIAEVQALLVALERAESVVEVPLDALVGVNRLVQAGLLVRHRSGELTFRHALLRDTLYGLLSEAERTSLHHIALGIYRTLVLPDEYALPRIALHAAASAENEEAADAYLKLGRRALAGQGYLEAESAFSAAIAQLAGKPDARNVEATRGRGLMRSRLGRQEDALRDLRKARELAQAVGLTQIGLEIALDEAIVHDWLRNFPASEACVRELELTPPDEGSLLHVRLLVGLGRAAHRRGDSELSVAYGVRAAELARNFGDAGYESRIIALLMVAPDCAYLGRIAEAATHFEEVLREASAHSDTAHVAAAYVNRVALWYTLRNTDALVADLQRVITLAREIGEPLIEYIALNNLGETKYAVEDLEAARDYTQRGLTLAHRLWGSSSREVAMAELLLARIAVYTDNLEEAARHMAQVRSLHTPSSPEVTAISLSPFEELVMRAVELSLADSEALGAWAALIDEASAADMPPQELLEVMEARALWAQRVGLLPESAEYASRALEAARTRPSLLGERLARRLQLLISRD